MRESPLPYEIRDQRHLLEDVKAILGKFNQGSLTTKNYNVKAGRRKANPSDMKCH